MSAKSERLIELLSAYIDGEVSPEERAEAERLIAEDTEAAELYHSLTSTSSLLKRMDRVSAPPTLRHQLRTKMITSRQIPFFQRLRFMVEQRRIRMPQVVYLSSIVVIILLLYYTSNSIFLPVVEKKAELEFQTSSPETVEAVRLRRGPVESTPDLLVPAGNGVYAPQVESPFPLFDSGEPVPPQQRYALAEGNADEEAGRPIAEAPLTEDTAVRPMMAPAAKTAPAENRPAAKEAKKAEEEPAPQREVVQDNEDRPQYRAKLDAVEDKATATGTGRRSDQAYVLESGNRAPFDRNAAPGSDANPLQAQVGFSVPVIDFTTFELPNSTDRVDVGGEIRIASSGRITWFRISGPQDARPVIDAFAAHLRASRQAPQLLNGRPVSILYQFTAQIVRTK